MEDGNKQKKGFEKKLNTKKASRSSKQPSPGRKDSSSVPSGTRSPISDTHATQLTWMDIVNVALRRTSKQMLKRAGLFFP